MHIFNWSDKAQWLKDINDYASTLLDEDLKKNLISNKSYCWSDSFEWLKNPEDYSKFFSLFLAHYTHICCFHGARPENIGSYLTNGITGQNFESLEKLFLRIYSDLPIEILKSAISDLSQRNSMEQGKIWVLLEKNEFIKNCGHYLIQGSEYIMALAANISSNLKNEDYTLRLKKLGLQQFSKCMYQRHIFQKNKSSI